MFYIDWTPGSHIIMGVSVRACWIRLTFKSVDWVKPIAGPLWVGLIQSVDHLSRTKGWPLPSKKSLLCHSLWAGLLAFCVWADWNWLFLDLQPVRLWLGKILSSPESPTCWLILQILGLVCLPNGVSQCLVTNLFACIIYNLHIVYVQVYQ